MTDPTTDDTAMFAAAGGPVPLEAGLFAVDRDNRIVRGLLVPYGERSRLSVSKTEPVMFRRGDVVVPADPDIVTLNRQHDRFDPIGRAAELEDTDRGIVAAFRIGKTPDGDAWLAEPGNLRRLSAEVRNMRRRADGTATAELVGGALVDEGAFASAALFAVDGSSTEHEVREYVDADGRTWRMVVDRESSTDTADDGTITTTSTTTVVEETKPAEPGTEQEEDTVTDAVPNTFAASTAAAPKHMSKGEMFAALHTIASGRATAELVERVRGEWGGGEAGLFALNDVAYDGAAGVGSVMAQPAWLGEVTDGVEYQPLYADLFTPADLTSLAMQGWRWVTKPEGGTWAGNKTDVPSNPVDVELVSENAERWAMGHDHAREHRDFNTPGYFESYWAAATESFLRWLDGVTITGALAEATPIEADNPAGLTIDAGLSAVIDGAAAVIEAGRIPTFALLPSTSWKRVLKTPKSEVLGYLDAALGLDRGTLDGAGFVLRPARGADLPVGTQALVGARGSGRVYRLPGSPIRAEALDIARGGIDTGAFGYGGFMPVNAEALVEVTTYTP